MLFKNNRKIVSVSCLTTLRKVVSSTNNNKTAVINVFNQKQQKIFNFKNFLILKQLETYCLLFRYNKFTVINIIVLLKIKKKFFN